LIKFGTDIEDRPSLRIVSEMTYTVLRGTLNSTIPYHTLPAYGLRTIKRPIIERGGGRVT